MGGCVQLQLMHSPHRAKTGYERAARHHTIRYIVLSIASALVSGCDDSFFLMRAPFASTASEHGGEIRNMRSRNACCTCSFRFAVHHALAICLLYMLVLQCNMRSQNACCTCSLRRLHVRKLSSLETRVFCPHSCRFLFGPVCAVNCGTVLRYTKARSTAPRSNYQQMKR